MDSKFRFRCSATGSICSGPPAAAQVRELEGAGWAQRGRNLECRREGLAVHVLGDRVTTRACSNARPLRTAGGRSHGGEDAEGEEEKGDVPEMRGLTSGAWLAAGWSEELGGGRNLTKTTTASGRRRLEEKCD